MNEPYVDVLVDSLCALAMKLYALTGRRCVAALVMNEESMLRFGVPPGQSMTINTPAGPVVVCDQWPINTKQSRRDQCERLMLKYAAELERLDAELREGKA